MRILVIILSVLAMSNAASAALGKEQVEQTDKARAGNLPELVLAEAKKLPGMACDEFAKEKFEIVQLGFTSGNETKTPDTPYSYEANYLVILKCLYGSTFGGASGDVEKAIVMKGEFTSNYNKAYGPAKMRDLKIEFVKDTQL